MSRTCWAPGLLWAKSKVLAADSSAHLSLGGISSVCLLSIHCCYGHATSVVLLPKFQETDEDEMLL
eukprot:6968391-Lingulodinium_polyedra.AAC.1